MLGSGAMDAGQALADLAAVSSQIEGAVLLQEDGTLLASTFADDGRSQAVAARARELLQAARESRAATGRAELSHVLAATPAGAVFLVRDGQRAVAAVTRPEPTIGLVFYDLKTCLRLTDAESDSARRGRKAAGAAKSARGSANAEGEGE
jgi:predicted regulator of Ras-like GTPase activity (Roadblock/LC7/MglB family)